VLLVAVCCLLLGLRWPLCLPVHNALRLLQDHAGGQFVPKANGGPLMHLHLLPRTLNTLVLLLLLLLGVVAVAMCMH